MAGATCAIPDNYWL